MRVNSEAMRGVFTVLSAAVTVHERNIEEQFKEFNVSVAEPTRGGSSTGKRYIFTKKAVQ